VIYNRKTVLGLRLRSSVELKKLSRNEFFSRLQLIRVLDPITDGAYKEIEERVWREQHDDAPHGHPWHVSFHASQFPGDNPMACARQALYQMMDLPPQKPFNRHVRALMSAGKGIEVELVRAWHEAGILLSAPPDAEVQTGFELPESWLTASVDSVILPPQWNKPLPVEIKTKYQADIDRMKLGAQGPDPQHVAQLKVQLAMVSVSQPTLWPGLDPVTHGFIYYMSRDRPSDTAEFRVDFDQKYFEVGLERLKQWRGYFMEDVLPELKPGKRESRFGHPNGWRWSYPPCQWCRFANVCKEDFRAGITALSESTGIQNAPKIRPHYSYEDARQRVLSRWSPDRERDKIRTSHEANGG